MDEFALSMGLVKTSKNCLPHATLVVADIKWPDGRQKNSDRGSRLGE